MQRRAEFVLSDVTTVAGLAPVAIFGPCRVVVDREVNGSGESESMRYPNGVVKKTWSAGHERTGDDIKLEEVLEPETLETAVLSSYIWDVDWVLAKVKTPLRGGTTQCIFVMQARSDSDQEQWRKGAASRGRFLRLCFPSMFRGGVHCMHSKLMLLFHAHKLRIAIPTGNLVGHEWGETGQVENTVFLIDLPRRRRWVGGKPQTFFQRELDWFLEKQGLDGDVRRSALAFDFSATKGLAFIHTIGGAHQGPAALRTGFFGLSQAVNTLGLQTERIELDFAASSVGNLNDKYLREIRCAAKGELGGEQAREGVARADGCGMNPSTRIQTALMRESIRIYFPTEDTVRASYAGSTSTICLLRRHFEAEGFPRSVFRNHRSTRSGLLSHNKILCARGKKRNGGEGENVAWVYVGSANASPSAWGQLSPDRGIRKITCRNWECGVLIPVVNDKLRSLSPKENLPIHAGEDSGAGRGEEADEPGGMLVDIDVFGDVLSLPFEVPGAWYCGRNPWYKDER